MAILGFAVAIFVTILVTNQSSRGEFRAAVQELQGDIWDIGLRVDMVGGAVDRDRSKLSRSHFFFQNSFYSQR